MNRAFAVVAAVLFLLSGGFVKHAAAGVTFDASIPREIGIKTNPRVRCIALLSVFARDQWAAVRNNSVEGGFVYDDAAKTSGKCVGDPGTFCETTSAVPAIWRCRQCKATRGLLPSLARSTQQELLTNATRSIGRGGLSPIGSAIQSHATRPGTFFQAGRSAADNTAIGERFLGSVLETGTITRSTHGVFGSIMDVRLASGAGVRFTEAGEFIGLLERFTPR